MISSTYTTTYSYTTAWQQPQHISRPTEGHDLSKLYRNASPVLITSAFQLCLFHLSVALLWHSAYGLF